MFEKLRTYLNPETANSSEIDSSGSLNSSRIQVASAALMIEMAGSDGHFSQEELRTISASLQKVFKINIDTAEEIIRISKEELKESVSLYEFSGIINEFFSREEKIELMDNLWRIIYTDKKLDKYEDKLIKQIGGILQLDHKDVISSKLFIKQEIEKLELGI